MLPAHSIVVGVPPESPPKSASGETRPVAHAIQTACEIATSASGRQVILASVVDSIDEAQPQSEHLSQLREELLEAFDELSIETCVTAGTAWDGLLAIADEFESDLILFGMRPASSDSRVAIGPTAMKVVRHAKCAVGCLRPGRIGLDWTVAVADSLKGSLGETLLEWGVEWALANQAGMLAVHVSDEPADEEREASLSSTILDRLSMTDFRSIARGVRPLILEGQVDRAILSTVEGHDIDLLILGTGSDVRDEIGLIAESLLPQLPCSVIVVPQKADP